MTLLRSDAKGYNVEWEEYWLKAKENLEMAALAYQNKKYNVSASRAYYAAFLACIVALIRFTDFRAKDNEWQHGQVQAELNRQLIMRRKLLPSDLGRTPMDLMELRHVADYKPQLVTAREAKRANIEQKDFVLQSKQYLGESV